MKRRTHGKRSIIARIASTRRAIRRAETRTIERVIIMELQHADLALKQARMFVLRAERLAAKAL